MPLKSVLTLFQCIPVLLHHLGKYYSMKRENIHVEEAGKPEEEYSERA